MIHVVPKNIPENQLINAAKYRSKSRFPSMSYYDQIDKVSMWRCSQPTVLS